MNYALLSALNWLQQAEAHYRLTHDLRGDGHRETGRMWDEMRRAGDYARKLLATGEGREAGEILP